MYVFVTNSQHTSDPRAQSKQMQIDALLAKAEDSVSEIEKLREEKDQEIEILQAGMDSTIEQLNDARQVCYQALHL